MTPANGGRFRTVYRRRTGPTFSPLEVGVAIGIGIESPLKRISRHRMKNIDPGTAAYPDTDPRIPIPTEPIMNRFPSPSGD
jgi:hypothetical protein